MFSYSVYSCNQCYLCFSCKALKVYSEVVINIQVKCLSFRSKNVFLNFVTCFCCKENSTILIFECLCFYVFFFWFGISRSACICCQLFVRFIHIWGLIFRTYYQMTVRRNGVLLKFRFGFIICVACSWFNCFVFGMDCGLDYLYKRWYQECLQVLLCLLFFLPTFFVCCFTFLSFSYFATFIFKSLVLCHVLCLHNFAVVWVYCDEKLYAYCFY